MNKKTFYKLFKNKIFSTLFISLISFFLFLFILKSGVFYNVDKLIQNNFYSLINNLNQKTVSKEIVVVRIDEPTIKSL
jgi:ATP/ADP translocase